MNEICQGRVLIIGAGIAGLVAASHLLKNGFNNVTILEAENRIGGRIHTIPFGDGNLEMGAQWIHGEIDNPLCEYALDNGLVNSEVVQPAGEGRGCYYTQDGQVIDSTLVKEVQLVMDAADDDCCTFHKEESLTDKDPKGQNFEDMTIPSSVEDFFEKRFCSYLEKTSDSPEVRRLKEGLYRWHLTFQCLDNACYSMRQVSAATWGEFQYYEGEHWVSLPSGYDSVLQKLCKNIQKDNILTNKCVTSIEWGEQCSAEKLYTRECSENVFHSHCSAICHEIHDASNNQIQESSSYDHGFAIRVKCKDGSCFLADTVVLTVSLGVLKNCHKVMFRPPLPLAKQRVIGNMGFGTLNKIFLIFDRPFWEKSTEGFQLVWTDEDAQNSPNENTSLEYPWYKDITGFDVVPNHSNILMGWIGRHGAEVMETLSEEDVGDTCLNILKKFTNCQITSLVKVIRSSWSSSPNFRGSYSFRTVQSDKEGSHTKDLAAPVISRYHRCANHPLLHFAGEATEIQRFSTVHGAFISGMRVAENIVFHNKHELVFLCTGRVSSTRTNPFHVGQTRRMV